MTVALQKHFPPLATSSKLHTIRESLDQSQTEWKKTKRNLYGNIDITGLATKLIQHTEPPKEYRFLHDVVILTVSSEHVQKDLCQWPAGGLAMQECRRCRLTLSERKQCHLAGSKTLVLTHALKV